ncbi:MAG: DUF3298 domain-containing protein [Bacteroidales bacterium]|nr:DUF3298 domain-containing protein [Bacteroidales bacterium]
MVTADLNITGSEITGFYYYFFPKAKQDSGMHYGKTIPLTGTVDGATITMREFGSNGSEFMGHVYRHDSISGFWKTEDEERKLRFYLTENNENNLSFRYFSRTDSTYLFPGEDAGIHSPRALFTLAILIPECSISRQACDSIEAALWNWAYGGPGALSTPDEGADLLISDFFETYRLSAEGLDLHNAGASFNWEKRYSTTVEFNESGIVCLKLSKYVFSGGAHGLNMEGFMVFDAFTGSRITLSDLFNADSLPVLRTALNRKIREMFGISPGERLSDAGFFADEVDQTENFYIHQDGMGFVYNLYSIGPHALGVIDIFLDFGEIKELLRDVSPVRWIY